MTRAGRGGVCPEFKKRSRHEPARYATTAKIQFLFVHSEAFKTKSRFFIEALQETTAKLPEVTCSVCEHFVHVMESEPSDKRPDSLETQMISQLLFRLYSQSNDEHMKSRCLDMIDRMLYLNWYGVDDVLKQYER
jgi:hypothetical protein